MSPHAVAITASFFMEGLRDTNKYDEILDAWGCGALELVAAMCEHAEYATQLMIDGGSRGSGIYAYDVCSEFGRWFGEQLMVNYVAGKMRGGVYPPAPSYDACRMWLHSAADGFFSGKD